jgi:uncharacterized membrane protein
MLIYRLFSLLFIVIFSVGFTCAQNSGNKAKDAEKQQIALLEQIGKDAEGLRLPENRALILAKMAEGYWLYDEKLARSLFLDSVNALIAAQTQAEMNKKAVINLYSLVNGVSPRQEILTLIANRDAEFALELFYKSRPGKIAQILANPVEAKKPGNQQYSYSEIYFEQNLMTRVAEQNPQRAINLIRESLAKGITWEAVGLIDRIKEKNPELAAEFAGVIADKFLYSDFDKQSQDFGLAMSFITQYGKKPEDGSKPVKIDEKKLRDLAVRIARQVLKDGEEEYYDIESLLPIMEKFSPENVVALKQKLAKQENTAERREYAAYEKFMETNPSPEKLLAEAEKFPESLRSQIYYAAAEKSAQNGNLMQAQKIISTKMSQEETESYMTQINYGVISKAISEEKFDEANALINNIDAENSRLALLLQLATSIYQKNPAENKKQTLAVLEQARALVPQPAETLEDMSNLLQIAITLAEIEAEQSFVTIESMTASINEYVEAANVVAKYRNEGTLRQGEMIITAYGGISGLYNLNPILTQLKNKDFKRTMSFINGLQRLEARLSLLIQLIDTSQTGSTTNITMPVQAGG